MKTKTSENVAGRENSVHSIVRAARYTLESALASVDALDQALSNARDHAQLRDIAQAHINIPPYLSHPKVNDLDPWRFGPRLTADRYAAEALRRAWQNNPALERARDHELARLLARADTSDLRRDLDRAHARIGDLHRDLERTHIPGHEHARDLAHDIDSAQNCARNLADALHRAIKIEHFRLNAPLSDFDRGRTRTYGLRDVNDMLGDLNHALRHSWKQVNDLRRSLNRPSVTGEDGQHHGRVSQPAIHLAGAATGMLPRRDRARYGEEWRGELRELATAGAGKWQQLRHAGRLLGRTASLRHALADRQRRRRTTQ